MCVNIFWLSGDTEHFVKKWVYFKEMANFTHILLYPVYGVLKCLINRTRPEFDKESYSVKKNVRYSFFYTLFIKNPFFDTFKNNKFSEKCPIFFFDCFFLHNIMLIDVITVHVLLKDCQKVTRLRFYSRSKIRRDFKKKIFL